MADPVADEVASFSERFHLTLAQLTKAERPAIGASHRTCVMQDDRTALYHYQPITQQRIHTPLLIVYAQINHPAMLDLEPGRSLIEQLLLQGVDVYLIDWGNPTLQDQHNSLSDYILGYLDTYVQRVLHETQQPLLSLMGVCQGGVFATIYAAIFPKTVRNLITLVTPIDFSVESILFGWARTLNTEAIAKLRLVPAELLNLGFRLLRPTAGLQKYLDLMDWVTDGEKLNNFLRLEQWIYEGPDQPGACFSEFIKQCVQENCLVNGTLALEGHRVELKQITMPLLNILATEDNIIPPAASRSLNRLVGSGDTQLLEFESGHIGIFVSKRLQSVLGPTICNWLAGRD